MTSQTSELVERLVHQAYEEGFSDGCTVEAGEAAMPHYEETEAYRKTKLLLERLSSSEVTEGDFHDGLTRQLLIDADEMEACGAGNEAANMRKLVARCLEYRAALAAITAMRSAATSERKG